MAADVSVEPTQGLGLLDSTAHTSRSRVMHDTDPDLDLKVGASLESILVYHLLSDGNKRMGGLSSSSTNSLTLTYRLLTTMSTTWSSSSRTVGSTTVSLPVTWSPDGTEPTCSFSRAFICRQHYDRSGTSPHHRIRGYPPAGQEYVQMAADGLPGSRLRWWLGRASPVAVLAGPSSDRGHQPDHHSQLHPGTAVARWAGVPVSRIVALTAPPRSITWPSKRWTTGF